MRKKSIKIISTNKIKKSKLKFALKSFVVSASSELSFNIYNYLGVKIPKNVIEDWDSDDQIPCKLEARCYVALNNRKISNTVSKTSDQLRITSVPLPAISIMHNCVSREIYSIDWNPDDPIVFPINYCELPKDSVIIFDFYVKFFGINPVSIGRCSLKLFTIKNKKLRNGPHILTFENESDKNIEKAFRKIQTGKEERCDYVDNQFNYLLNYLHPKDVESYFNALLNPELKPLFSRCEKFVTIDLLTPEKENDYSIIHHDYIVDRLHCCSLYNPYQRLFQDLAHSETSKLLKDSNLIEIFNTIKLMPPLSDLPPYQKSLLCSHVSYCLKNPQLIPPLFRSIDWDNQEEYDRVNEQLKTCHVVDIEYALEFFTPRFERKPIREFAIRCISMHSSSDLILYVPQLIQAVKSKYSDGLDELLIKHASNDIIFATKLYWNAQIEANDEEKLNILLKELKEKASKEIKNSLDDQINLVQNILSFLEEAQRNNKTPASVREKARELLSTGPFADQLLHFNPVRLPLDPYKIAIGIDPKDIKVFQSKLKPIMLTFILDNGKKYRVIFKIGDDMRQDQLIIQLFEVMDYLLKSASLPLPITAYSTLAFSPSFGCCEFIENSSAIRDIKDSKSGPTTIRGFIEEKEGSIEQKIEIFTKSLAAYCVMTYILKIGDRHDNNILVTRDGRLLHIDYGFILGDVTKPFTPPLKLSSEMVETIGPDGLSKICSWAGPAFIIFRKHSRLILTLIELMFTAPLACFQENPMRRLQQVENTLLLNCTEMEAINLLSATFSEALHSKMQVIWDAVHVMALQTTASSATN